MSSNIPPAIANLWQLLGFLMQARRKVVTFFLRYNITCYRNNKDTYLSKFIRKGRDDSAVKTAFWEKIWYGVCGAKLFTKNKSLILRHGF